MGAMHPGSTPASTVASVNHRTTQAWITNALSSLQRHFQAQLGLDSASFHRNRCAFAHPGGEIMLLPGIRQLTRPTEMVEDVLLLSPTVPVVFLKP